MFRTGRQRGHSTMAFRLARAVPLLLSIIPLTACLNCDSSIVGALETAPSDGTGDAPTDDMAGIDGGSPSIPIADATPSVSFRASTVFCCNPLSIDFVAEPSATLGTGALRYEWDFGDAKTALGQVVQHTYRTAGDYLVSLLVFSPDGPVASLSRYVSVSGFGGGVTVLPNDELPGGDGAAPDATGLDGQAKRIVADAGDDRTVAPGTNVKLDGTRSRGPDGSAITYQWRQTSGPLLSLFDPRRATASFVAPDVPEESVSLGFELTVETRGLRDSDVVAVTVVRAWTPPDVDVPPGATVVFLSGPNGVSPPGTAEVSWTFVSATRPARVFLRQDCCGCSFLDSETLAPDQSGIYRSPVEVPRDGTIFYSVLYSIQGREYRSQSVFVNPPPGRPAPPPPIIWYQHHGRDPKILQDVFRAGVVTHVMIGGGDRIADVFDHPTVLEDIELCRAAGVEVIWSRHLWNNWERFETLDDSVDPSFYITVIDQVRAEAEALRIPQIALDCEVYGNSPLASYYDADLPPEHYAAMQEALEQASQTHQVDFVYPSGTSGQPLHHNNLYRILAPNRISEGTYWDRPYKLCSIDYPYEIAGAYIQPTTERHDKGLLPYFLPYDIVERRYLWSQADGAPAGVNGLLLYPGAAATDEPIIREVAKMLADHFAGN